MFWITGRKKANDSKAASNLVVVLLINTVLCNMRTLASEEENQIEILPLTQSHLLQRAHS